MSETKSYEDLTSAESLSFQRSGGGLTFESLFDYYQNGSGPLKFFSPIRYWSFDPSGTVNDAVITLAIPSASPSVDSNSIQYAVPWSIARFVVPFEEFFRLYTTESTAYMPSASEVSGGSADTSSFEESPGLSTSLTWRTQYFSGSSNASV